MSFGDDLACSFLQEQEIFKKRDEVTLFRCLKRGFCETVKRNKKVYHVDELHGKIGMVGYINDLKLESLSGVAVTEKSNCEMSDLIFIIYSKSKKECRLTYMQNKLEKKMMKKKKETFFVDTQQLGLLKGRPCLEIANKYKALPNYVSRRILIDAKLNSVGSYGVFYEHGIDKYEMFYCSADIIEYLNQPFKKSKHKGISWNDTLEEEKIDGYTELKFAKTVKKFGDELVNLKIGTPLRKNEIALFQKMILKANLKNGIEFCMLKADEICKDDFDSNYYLNKVETELENVDYETMAGESLFIIDADTIDAGTMDIDDVEYGASI